MTEQEQREVEQQRQRMASAEQCIAEISLVVKGATDKHLPAAISALLREHTERRVRQVKFNKENK